MLNKQSYSTRSRLHIDFAVKKSFAISKQIKLYLGTENWKVEKNDHKRKIDSRSGSWKLSTRYESFYWLSIDGINEESKFWSTKEQPSL